MKILSNLEIVEITGNTAYFAVWMPVLRSESAQSLLQAERSVAQALTRSGWVLHRAGATFARAGGPARPAASARRRCSRRRTGSEASDRCSHGPAIPPETSPGLRPRRR